MVIGKNKHLVRACPEDSLFRTTRKMAPPRKRANMTAAVSSPGLCDLPNELLRRVMAELDSRSLCRLGSTCRRLRDLAVDIADELVHERLGFPDAVGHDVWDESTALVR